MEKTRYEAVITLIVTYPTYEHNARYVANDLKDAAEDGVRDCLLNDNCVPFVTSAVQYKEV